MTGLSWRIAEEKDAPALKALMTLAIEELLKDFLSPEEVEASHASMGLDTQLLADGTYFMVMADGELAGCGGWGKRATLYGGDHTVGRSAALLDPATDAARIRAMYTHPKFARRGIGRLVLALGEAAAGQEGFKKLVLGATLGGEPLYRAYGFAEVERGSTGSPSGVRVPIITMEKPVDLESAELTIAMATGRATR